LIEAAVALAAGVVAGSVALQGFGIDSGVELLAGGVIVWLFTSGRGSSAAAERLRPRRGSSPGRLLGRHRTRGVHRPDDAAPRAGEAEGRSRARIIGDSQRGEPESALRVPVGR